MLSKKSPARRPGVVQGLMAGAAVLALQAPALAQEAPAAEGGVVRYEQDFFARYNVTSAEDMLRRLPGVAAILDAASSQQQDRGFGSGGAQILIDGKRMAGKSNEVSAALRRIQAANVLRVELIRGASADLDVQSEGLVVNIVLRAQTAARGSGSFEINHRSNDKDFSDFDGLLSYSGAWRGLSFVAGIERNLWTPPSIMAGQWSDRVRNEVYRYPDGVLRERRPMAMQRDHDKRIYTANLGYDFGDGSSLRLNGFVQTLSIREADQTPLVRFDTAGRVASEALELHVRDSKDRLQLEFGGEYERRIGPGRAALILISRRSQTPTDDFRDRVVAGRVIEVSRSYSDQTTGEDILRGSYAFPLFAGQQLEIGAEAARNTLEQELEVHFDLNGDGRVERVPIPTAHAEVEELRAEAFVKHNWTITPKLTLESSLNVEVSRVSTNYPFNPKREYVYPKPRFDLRYALMPRDQLRFKIERTVSQLDFVNFVPVYDLVDDEIDAGNPNLEPEKTWIYEGRYEHRLAQDQGVLEVRGFYRDVSDHIDKVTIGRDVRGRLFSANGNLDKARVYGLEAKASVRLRPVGLPDAQLTVRRLEQTTSVEDPFTGRDRWMKGYWRSETDLGFRHDVSGLGLSYGINYRDYDGDQVYSDLYVRETYWIDEQMDLFVEKALVRNLTLRFEASGLTGSREYKSRVLFADDAVGGAVSRRDFYEEVRDKRFALKLRGKF